MTDNSRTAGAARRFWLRQVSWRGMALVAAISLLMGIVQATAAWSEQGPTEAVKGTVSELLRLDPRGGVGKSNRSFGIMCITKTWPSGLWEHPGGN